MPFAPDRPVPIPSDVQLIETMRVDAGRRIPLWEGHAARLAASCAALGYPLPPGLETAVARTAAALPADRQAYRLRLLVDAQGRHDMETAPLPPLPARPRVRLAAQRLDPDAPLLRHKTTHRPWYAEAAGWLTAHPEHFDWLYLNARGELCEGSRSNVYVERDGVWLTPALDCGLLPGVQRAALLREGLAREAVLTLDDLLAAPALRLSNGLRGWFDVRLDPIGPDAAA